MEDLREKKEDSTGFVTFFHDRFVFNGRGALRILSRCPAPDAIALLPGHESSSFPLSFITVEKLRAAYFHDRVHEGKRRKIISPVFIRARVGGELVRNGQLREITDS